jgi:hypothetical protein
MALAAILLQLALSFAHIHAPAPLPQLAVADRDAGSHPSPPAAGDCAICATIAAFAGLALPALVRLVRRDGWIVRLLPAATGWVVAAAPYRLFRTRAPPAV